jgi:hypothetical protein
MTDDEVKILDERIKAEHNQLLDILINALDKDKKAIEEKKPAMNRLASA